MPLLKKFNFIFIQIWCEGSEATRDELDDELERPLAGAVKKAKKKIRQFTIGCVM